MRCGPLQMVVLAGRSCPGYVVTGGRTANAFTCRGYEANASTYRGYD